MSLRPHTLPPAQDMPPPGGFKKIDTVRHFPARGPKGWQIWLGVISMMSYGFWTVGLTNRQRAEQKLEDRRIRYAIAPLLQAEADREFLRREAENHAKEAEIMASVKGWKVGESVYFSKKRRFKDPHKRL